MAEKYFGVYQTSETLALCRGTEPPDLFIHRIQTEFPDVDVHVFRWGAPCH